jgi:hypothetical protein
MFGIIFTGGNRSKGRETCPSETLSTINPTRTGPGVNPAMGRLMDNSDGILRPLHMAATVEELENEN